MRRRYNVVIDTNYECPAFGTKLNNVACRHTSGPDECLKKYGKCFPDDCPLEEVMDDNKY